MMKPSFFFNFKMMWVFRQSLNVMRFKSSGCVAKNVTVSFDKQ